MKIAFIARASLYTSKGGDTVQILQTARHLRQMGVTVDIYLSGKKLDEYPYDLLHFFNLIRPNDILPYLNHLTIPFVVTPLFIDYSEFDRQHRKGISGKFFRHLSSDQIEYLKVVARWLKGQQRIPTLSYLIRGHRRCVATIIKKMAMLLPNSEMEYLKLVQDYPASPPYRIIFNGIDEEVFRLREAPLKEKNMVLCVARVEGIKNQLNLIKALNDTEFELYLIGSVAANQMAYYRECQRVAASNVHFIHHLTPEKLVHYYQKAHIHILPSWFETCGLSTLEAAAMGCQVIITNRGYAAEYCNGFAHYCEPSSPQSIRQAIEKAGKEDRLSIFPKKIVTDYTWEQAARKTLDAYQQILYK